MAKHRIVEFLHDKPVVLEPQANTDAALPPTSRHPTSDPAPWNAVNLSLDLLIGLRFCETTAPEVTTSPQGECALRALDRTMRLHRSPRGRKSRARCRKRFSPCDAVFIGNSR